MAKLEECMLNGRMQVKEYWKIKEYGCSVVKTHYIFIDHELH